LVKGEVVRCFYDGNSDEFTITVHGKDYVAKNINADNMELHPFVYLHRKDNQVTLKILWLIVIIVKSYLNNIIF